MATTLLACSQCAELIKLGDVRCPHCECAVPRERSFARPAAAVLMGLSLSACVAQPAYGVPETESSTETTETQGTQGTQGTDTSGTGTSGTASGTGTSGTATSGDSDSGTGTSGDMTTAEPAYGVPETVSGGVAPPSAEVDPEPRP